MYETETEKDKVSQQQDFMRVGTCGYHGDGFVTELFPFSFNSIFVPLGDAVSACTRGWQCRTYQRCHPVVSRDCVLVLQRILPSCSIKSYRV